MLSKLIAAGLCLWTLQAAAADDKTRVLGGSRRWPRRAGDRGHQGRRVGQSAAESGECRQQSDLGDIFSRQCAAAMQRL